MSADDLTEMDRVLRHAVEAQGMMKHMGAKVDCLEAGKAVFSLPRRDEILQQNGFFHGGAIAFLIDVTATTAAATLVDRGKQSCLTAEYKLKSRRAGCRRGDRLRGRRGQAGPQAVGGRGESVCPWRGRA